MLDLGGNVLKSLFGVATITDLHQLLLTFDELKANDAEIMYSLSNQVTSVRNLDHTARVNTKAIANLSSIVSDFIIRSHDRFGEVTRDILWLNVAIHSQSEIYMSVRQLEFSLLQLMQQVDELLAAIQSIMGGRLPMTLVNPLFLHNILRNVSLQLSEN